MNWSTGLGILIEDYYNELFEAKGVMADSVLECIGEQLTMAQNEELSQDFNEEEVKQAIFVVHSDKSPGSDGMNPGFYQKFWNIIGKDVAKECIHILAWGIIPGNLNDTLVVLIPKKANPETMDDPRLISLCNVMMKIMT